MRLFAMLILFYAFFQTTTNFVIFAKKNTCMNLDLIKCTLDESLHFLYGESESVCDDDLIAEYDYIIGQLELALKEFE